MNALLAKIKKIHFIGIGGIGVSALARMMLTGGKRVSGSDATLSEITAGLVKLGATIHEGHDIAHVPHDCDVVVYSPAVRGNNPELLSARERGIPTYSYPEMLGRVSERKKTIAVSGTHGKTTTTAMLAEIFVHAKKDPTVVVGSVLRKQKSNFIGGKGEWFIVEACEYQRSFLHLSPKILVITNIDNDHLDYYGTIRNVQKAFNELARKVPKNGFIICNPKDKKVKPALVGVRAKIIDYTRERVPKLSVPGEHNRMNARAARAMARAAGISGAIADTALTKFHGTWRRLEYKGKMKNGALVYDDYAHHPTEIRATLSALREEYPKKRITVLFQPHLYSRTKLLLKDFAKSFADADRVLISDIYAAREIDDGTIHARDLAVKIGKKAHYVGTLRKMDAHVGKNLTKEDIFITMGAGDIYKLGAMIMK